MKPEDTPKKLKRYLVRQFDGLFQCEVEAESEKAALEKVREDCPGIEVYSAREIREDPKAS